MACWFGAWEGRYSCHSETSQLCLGWTTAVSPALPCVLLSTSSLSNLSQSRVCRAVCGEPSESASPSGMWQPWTMPKYLFQISSPLSSSASKNFSSLKYLWPIITGLLQGEALWMDWSIWATAKPAGTVQLTLPGTAQRRQRTWLWAGFPHKIVHIAGRSVVPGIACEPSYGRQNGLGCLQMVPKSQGLSIPKADCLFMLNVQHREAGGSKLSNSISAYVFIISSAGRRKCSDSCTGS